eukprot:6371784-Amphidinium_carterae.1
MVRSQSPHWSQPGPKRVDPKRGGEKVGVTKLWSDRAGGRPQGPLNSQAADVVLEGDDSIEFTNNLSEEIAEDSGNFLLAAGFRNDTDCC